MLKFFKNKANYKENSFSKIASLLIYAAKLDEDYTEKEEQIIDGEVIKYNSETLRFLSAKSGKFSILTRFTYSTTKDLLEGNKPNKITCYMTDGSIDFEFETPKEIQKENLELLGITYAQAKTYQKFCQYNNY